MPYAIAHPVAAIPAARAMGRHAVVSALVIGSVIPDAWYLVPGLERPYSHDASGLLVFCLPAGFVAYLLFHLLLKEPLLQLLPRDLAGRARAFACRGLPRASWLAVLASLLVGALTHLVWDAFTHEGRLSRAFALVLTENVLRVLQHASTLLGSAYLAWWTWRRLGQATPRHAPVLALPERILVLSALGSVFAVGFAMAWPGLEATELRRALRVGAAGAAAGLGAALLAYSILFRLRRR